MHDPYVEYIKKILGIKAYSHKWNLADNLPYYMQINKYQLLSFLDNEYLMIIISTDEFDLSNFIKQMNNIKQYTRNPLILGFDRLTHYQRLALIKNNIPFIVPNNQLYLPFLGIVLQEHYKSQPPKKEKLTAMAQFLLLNLIYKPHLNMSSKAEIAESIEQSNMNISRSIQELKSLGLIREEISGRRSLVFSMYDPKEMYHKAKQFMSSPVQKKVYLKDDALNLNLPIAGLEALSIRSFLNGPDRKVRAIDRKSFKSISKNYIINTPLWETSFDIVELEVWKYNPQAFANNDVVDPISLALSLKDSNDERIEIQIDKILEDFVC